MEKFDLIVIGSGPGGYVAAVRGAELGMKTAVVEKSELGGVCLNWGCIPTKALLKSASVLRYARKSSEYGISVEGEVKPDITKIVERSREVAAQMSKGIEFLLKKNGVTVICGEGSLEDKGVIRVKPADGGEAVMYGASHIILATGSRASMLPFAPIDGKKIIGYREALVPAAIPASLAVIGSGAIGCELAFFYRSLGTEVTVIEYVDRLAPLEDDDISAFISRTLRKEGIKVMTSSQVKAVDTTGDLCRVEVETKKGMETVEAEKVLSAVGVRPNTESLGLEKLGMETERGKVKVSLSDGSYRTSVDGIYAIGDIISTQALAHTASAEAVCCVEHIAGVSDRVIDYSIMPACIFISPETASVGSTERALKESGVEYKIAKLPFTASGKAAAAGERDGFVKLLSDANTGKILGAHLAGANVTEMVGGVSAAMTAGMTARALSSSIFPHPTMSESIMETSKLL